MSLHLKKLNKIRQKLLDINTYKCVLKRTFLKLLQKIYKFNNWHADAPFICRSYKRVVICVINRLNPDVVLEIGCGLGDIISRVNANKKFGIDQDINVIKVAKIFHKNVNFKEGSFKEVSILEENNINVLVMVNWLHELECKNIKNELFKLLETKKINYLVVDEILENHKGYKYHHHFRTFLKDKFTEIESFDEPENIRKIKVFKNNMLLNKTGKHNLSSM